ncbi:hypothetical protein GXM_03629 [Nostoc sphaeroides CCNUC1]|uniref:Uncharacterized protein n=1 Tax=Nostoc sphaeroides CCNUC1 TaxID=2653204 RepID=A0A5P8W2B3_9NOSO|nr:hypothetical protein GXM_03629 [Nostoc sphaeroides CCNUC1]
MKLVRSVRAASLREHYEPLIIYAALLKVEESVNSKGLSV